MPTHKSSQSRSAGSPAEAALTWLGGGDRRELGVIVLIGAALAWLVATLAVAGSTHWPVLAILPLTLLFGLLVGAVNRAVASGPTRSWIGIVGRGAVAVVVGALVGDLAAVVLFSGAIDRRLDEQAARRADATPAVVQAAVNLDRTRDARVALDNAVDEARIHRDQALVIARCEYNPTPACPQTRITGDPGQGPETRTANELFADSQKELDTAVAVRDRLAPGLDSEVADGERAVGQARNSAMAKADRSLGARWVAMHEYTLTSAAALLLRFVTIAFFALLSLLPLVLKLLRGETTGDRSAAACAECDRADLEADTAISVKRAEVRATIENMWAEQHLASARLAIEAQHEIDRELHRRRVVEAIDPPVVTLQRAPEPAEEDMYLPIAAEAEAASRRLAELPRGDQEAKNLPDRVEPDDRDRGTLIPTIPNVTKAAARWIRPFVPPAVARAIDTTTHPLRTARQVFEEVEEITFAFKRTHKVTVDSEESAKPTEQLGSVATETADGGRRVSSSRVAEEYADYGSLDAYAERSPLERARQSELDQRGEPGQLRRRTDPRELPPGE